MNIIVKNKTTMIHKRKRIPQVKWPSIARYIIKLNSGIDEVSFERGELRDQDGNLLIRIAREQL